MTPSPDVVRQRKDRQIYNATSTKNTQQNPMKIMITVDQRCDAVIFVFTCLKNSRRCEHRRKAKRFAHFDHGLGQVENMFVAQANPKVSAFYPISQPVQRLPSSAVPVNRRRSQDPAPTGCAVSSAARPARERNCATWYLIPCRRTAGPLEVVGLLRIAPRQEAEQHGPTATSAARPAARTTARGHERISRNQEIASRIGDYERVIEQPDFMRRLRGRDIFAVEDVCFASL